MTTPDSSYDWRSFGEHVTDDVRTPAVRLALRILRPYLTDRELLVTYWSEISAEKNVAFNHGAQALRWIVFELVKRGHSVWAGFR